MNLLNSSILEGAVLGNVSDSGLFQVKSERHARVGETEVTTTVTVLCQVPESMLDSVKKHATDGRGIRIIGRLEYLCGCQVGLFVEHLEYKPNFKRVGIYNFKHD